MFEAPVLDEYVFCLHHFPDWSTVTLSLNRALAVLRISNSFIFCPENASYNNIVVNGWSILLLNH